MNVGNRLGRFQFHDHLILNQKVKDMSSNQYILTESCSTLIPKKSVKSV